MTKEIALWELFLAMTGLISLTICIMVIKWKLEDIEIDRKFESNKWYIYDYLVPQQMCCDAMDEILKWATFWNDLGKFYLDAGLEDESFDCLDKCSDILEAITVYPVNWSDHR